MDQVPATIQGTALIADSASLQWYEAVAAVLQLGEALLRTGQRSLPDLSEITLSSDGSVALPPGPSRSEPPVAQVAGIAKLLFKSTTVPPELVRLVERVVDDPASSPSLDDLIEKLRYFERPGRPQLIRTLVERISSAETQARIAKELERLETKLREAHQAPPPPAPEPPPRRRARKLQIVAAIGIVCLLAAAAVLGWLRPDVKDAGNRVGPLVKQAGRGIAQAFNTGVERLLGRAQPTEPPATVEPTPSKTVAHIRTAHGKTQKAGTRTPADPDVVPNEPPPELISPEPERPFPTVIVVAVPVAEVESERDRIYSELDTDVTPPEPLQPVLGIRTTDTSGGFGDMDILVNESGNVERVTLLMPSTYQQRMLVYAMKARKFKPALKGSLPVRYRLRIRTAY